MSVKQLANSYSKLQYGLDFRVDEKKLEFSLKEKINFELNKPHKTIRFHSKGLTILRISMDNKELDFKYEDQDILEINLGTSKISGELDIEIKAPITDTLEGIYPSRYKEDGIDKIVLVTQLESHYARELFVCVDEPAAKAIFNISVEHDKNLTCLSNMDIKKETSTESYTKITEFNETPLMSSYLLCLAVGEFEFLEAKTVSGIRVRTYTTPQKLKSSRFALECAVKCLNFYEKYFEIKYALDKCDMLALDDFQSGAMENWGLITYRESCMLVDDNTSTREKQYVAMVIAHELAHQWFGNLVTMSWWTDLWLNEGFASFIEYLAVDNIFPDWQMWNQFLLEEKQNAFGLDSLENSHPVEVPIKHPDEIIIIFDGISYSKGASLIYMLQQYMGEEEFRKGIVRYLNKYSYSNAATSDLWTELESSSGLEIRLLMDKFTKQTGFPVLNVTENKLFQQRFTLLKKKSSTIWPIPLLTSSSDKSLLNDKHMKRGSVNYNSSSAGFYLVNYDRDTIHKLLTAWHQQDLRFKQNFLAEQLLLIKAGFSSNLDLVLENLDLFVSDNNQLLWQEVASIISTLENLFCNDNKDLKTLLRKKINILIGDVTPSVELIKSGNAEHLDMLRAKTMLGLPLFHTIQNLKNMH